MEATCVSRGAFSDIMWHGLRGLRLESPDLLVSEEFEKAPNSVRELVGCLCVPDEMAADYPHWNTLFPRMLGKCRVFVSHYETVHAGAGSALELFQARKRYRMLRHAAETPPPCHPRQSRDSLPAHFRLVGISSAQTNLLTKKGV